MPDPGAADAAAVTDEQRVREIRERVEAATEGPWKWQNANRGVLIDSEANSMPILELRGPDSAHHVVVRWRDLEFMAEARTDVPWLLAALAARDSRIGELEKALERCEELAADNCVDDSDCLSEIHAICEAAVKGRETNEQ